MTRAKRTLALAPERCDGCGRCEEVCAGHALKVGPGYLFVDWAKCDRCGECVDACDRGAIRNIGLPERRPPQASAPRVGPSPGDAAPAYLRAALTGPERRSTPTDGAPASLWSLGEAGGLIAIMVALVLVKDSVLTIESVREMSLEAVMWVRAGALAVYYAVSVTFLLWIARRGGASASERLRLRRPADLTTRRRAGAVGAVVGLLVLTRLATTGYVALALSVGWQPPGPGEAEFVRLFGSSTSGLLISAALVVLVAPVVEEAVFRGALLCALGRVMPRWAAIAISALLFAGLHLDAWMLVPTFLLGLALGWLASHRATLWPAIAMHALYNATAVAAAFFVIGNGVAPPA